MLCDAMESAGALEPIAVVKDLDEMRRKLSHPGLPTALHRAASARALPARAA